MTFSIDQQLLESRARQVQLAASFLEREYLHETADAMEDVLKGPASHVRVDSGRMKAGIRARVQFRNINIDSTAPYWVHVENRYGDIERTIDENSTEIQARATARLVSLGSAFGLV